MQRPDRLTNIELRDLTGSIPFQNWIKENLKLHEELSVSNEHLLIYLDYIEEKVRGNQELDRTLWLKTVKELRERIKVS